uniref:40S ribosomal protein S15a n=1 Tax=Eptatretus burgeri TaxID=7764 RepID=A0A8C4QRP8_EPTBU
MSTGPRVRLSPPRRTAPPHHGPSHVHRHKDETACPDELLHLTVGQALSTNCYGSGVRDPSSTRTASRLHAVSLSVNWRTFEIVDDHQAGKVVVNLTGRLNEWGVISPRFDVQLKDLEKWQRNLLPSGQFGIQRRVLVAGTSAEGNSGFCSRLAGPLVLLFFLLLPLLQYCCLSSLNPSIPSKSRMHTFFL